jgi:hypothetical protein
MGCGEEKWARLLNLGNWFSSNSIHKALFAQLPKFIVGLDALLLVPFHDENGLKTHKKLNEEKKDPLRDYQVHFRKLENSKFQKHQ